MIKFITNKIETFNGMLLLALPRTTSLDALQGLLTSDKPLRVQIDIPKQKKPRTLAMNAYCWLLCQQIAERSSYKGAIVTREQVYRKNIHELFAPVVRALPVQDVDFWLATWRGRGTGWLAERIGQSELNGCIDVGFWNGSSVFSVKEMSRLIDGLIQDAKELDIDVISEADKQLMLMEWGKRNG